MGCSVPGTSHVASGTPCQDACAYRILEDGSLLGAVADGAGTAKNAQRGSSVAAKSAVEYLAAHLESSRPEDAAGVRSLLEDCVLYVRDNIQREAQVTSPQTGEETCLRDFATTLIAFYLSGPFLGIVQVGDGALVFRKGRDELLLACIPERGEYLNETSFITSEDFEEHCQFLVESSDDVSAVSLFSDGLQMLALVYRDNLPHEPFFSPLFGFFCQESAGIEDLRHFLASDRVCAHSDDDKTLIVAVRMPASK